MISPAKLAAALALTCLAAGAEAQTYESKDKTAAALYESSASSECVQTTLNLTTFDVVTKQLSEGTVEKRNVIFIFFQTLDMCAREALTYGVELNDAAGLVLRKELDYATLDLELPDAVVRKCHVIQNREWCDEVPVPISLHARWTPNGQFMEQHGWSRMLIDGTYSRARSSEHIALADVSCSLSVDGEAYTTEPTRAHIGKASSTTLIVSGL